MGILQGENLLVTYFSLILYMKLEAEGDSLNQTLFFYYILYFPILLNHS